MNASHRVRVWTACLTLVLALVACKKDEPRPAPEPASPAPAPAAPDGRLVVRYPSTDQAPLAGLSLVLREAKVLDELAAQVNQVFRLPRELEVAVEACGEANAFYDPEKKRISLCLELVAYFAEQFASEGEQADAMLVDAALFILVHELGHALVDLLDLAITGREEDVSDQLATWFILETYGSEEEGVQAVLTAAAWFLGQFDEKAKLKDIPFWDSHPLEPQRFYNILCWCHGRFPELTAKVLGADLEAVLPEERRALCPDEYRRLDLALTRLLEGHLRPQPE
jgi:hypothetical protein